ncbi:MULTISPECIES: DUF3098 domain-containing protein [Kaistella]|uniref:DUF3098 domain-containing protein n=2 Tax=Kaistella TaxID=2782231 RepID=A0A0C1FFT0_9FLAO|nr:MULTISPECIES: DUF3098 domain-containing protein [Kaistella]KIA90653.1 hypothetical protein OA86_01880 [Kaistella jeonii]MBF8455982.1 DUF3098 domain-containing protein [Kaistella gelatinilytica]SFB69518.1 Protein of unknown function [Kaistella jeonii]VEI94745.1 Protein of uncharacterised function (DUF3098) [Kaistella jeonii]
MSKKNQKFSADNYGKKEVKTVPENTFYFGKENYKFMLIGLALIVVGFLLMMGPDANTVDGKYDPNVWNEGIFSIRRIRIAPMLVIAGFAVEVYAILKRKKV